MTRNRITIGLLTYVLVLTPVSTNALSIDVGASTTRSASTTTSVEKTPAQKLESKIESARKRTIEELDRRLIALNDYNSKIQVLVRLTTAQKINLEKFIQDEMVALSSLKRRVIIEQDLEALKSFAKSLTQRHNIFLLVMPQAHITVASDRIQSSIEKLTAIEVKFSSRIAEAKAGGMDTSAIDALDAEMKTALAAASENAALAVSLIADLTPDNGDKTKAASNRQALQNARTALRDGLKAVNDARSIAATIFSGLKGEPIDMPAAATTTTTP